MPSVCRKVSTSAPPTRAFCCQLWFRRRPAPRSRPSASARCSTSATARPPSRLRFETMRIRSVWIHLILFHNFHNSNFDCLGQLTYSLQLGDFFCVGFFFSFSSAPVASADRVQPVGSFSQDAAGDSRLVGQLASRRCQHGRVGGFTADAAVNAGTGPAVTGMYFAFSCCQWSDSG